MSDSVDIRTWRPILPVCVCVCLWACRVGVGRVGDALKKNLDLFAQLVCLPVEVGSPSSLSLPVSLSLSLSVCRLSLSVCPLSLAPSLSVCVLSLSLSVCPLAPS